MIYFGSPIKSNETDELEKLADKSVGKYTILKVDNNAETNSSCRKLSELGIITGKRVKIVINDKKGPLTVVVGNTKVAISRKIANNIYVN
ncbi:FeoA family protein [Methanococcus voltae]|uniref:Ferrous iron transport protein A n=2 Tax=Methanococcus voltae TaxID=2188 RepID=A0A8J7RF18_METVO|nr:FeoA family protein [Methanococcus voltae]MBP2172045.1 ferrous iron transport protein A [Methanococcus voltae]MBP2200999.1 ferrous iron transport protein A [Methanococcus voltae]MCS3921722.1 ferrous iron transport protein A [Methanococcus voltae PS]